MHWLRDIAQELNRRGSPVLARRILAIATSASTEFPEADELPPNPPSEEDVLKTGDYGEDLGVPPYDRHRPKTKGDEAED